MLALRPAYSGSMLRLRPAYSADGLAGAAVVSGLASADLLTGGEIGGGGEFPALMAGTAQVSAQATGTLTTAIPLAGASLIATTATGSLSTGIRLAGSSNVSAQAAADLTTAQKPPIALAGDAQAHVDASANLTIGAGLQGSAWVSVSARASMTGGTEVVERRRGAPIGPPLRTWRYAARIGGRMVYADTRQALQAAIADFEVSVPSRAEKKAQKAGKVVVRRLPKVQVVEAPAEERIEVQAQAQAANDRIAAEYLSALQAQIAIRAAMERDDMEAMIALDFL